MCLWEKGDLRSTSCTIFSAPPLSHEGFGAEIPYFSLYSGIIISVIIAELLGWQGNSFEQQ